MNTVDCLIHHESYGHEEKLISEFPTNRLEMNAVADIFDKDKDGFIDYKEFIAALRPEREPTEPKTEKERIAHEMTKQVQQCTCPSRYPVREVGEGRYTFGETQKLRLVRILRSTVMVRVGGGWTALDEFLVKNDPCRAKGRTNLELREKFILPEGASQTMQAFRTKPSRPGSSSGASSTLSTPQGPIIKIREKTERSLPLRATMNRAGSLQSPADSEVSSILSSDRRSSENLITPNVIRPASRRSGRGTLLGAYGSRPGSRGSRPPSRAGSDVSETGSVASRDSLGLVPPTRIPSARKKWRS